MERWIKRVISLCGLTVACGAAVARCGDLDGGMALPGYDVPVLSLDMPRFDIPLSYPAGYESGTVAPVKPMRFDPAGDYGASSRIMSWDDGFLAGYRSVTSLPGLMGVESGGFSAVQQFGPVTLTVDAGAKRYGMFRDSFTQLSAGGSATWRINDRLSLTVFGTYYTNQRFYSPAAMPYIGASNYGGYMTVAFSDNVGMAMGVKREYDASSGHWITVPIAAPYFNAWGQTVSVDFGGLIREVLVDSFDWRESHCPVVAPPRHVTPVAPRR